ncbi:hypothetical protein R5M92_03675 [Halomonas sp. Bachu 37]|uniref:hypothetical protein n=1 Tax=Halomonas kashgarensis TaxID=3084920 RepID=UPI003216F5A1
MDYHDDVILCLRKGQGTATGRHLANWISMKYQKAPKPLDERDKLRKFRELDDAFADALRQLDDPNNALGIPTGPPVRSLQSLENEQAQVDAEEREKQFKRQLDALLAEHDQPAASVGQLLQTLLDYDLWQEPQQK